jgi:hypothetical protein
MSAHTGGKVVSPMLQPSLPPGTIFVGAKKISDKGCREK